MKCIICGEEFKPKVHNQKVCNKDHIHPCPVCGKDVISNDPKRQNCTCSRKCGQQLGNEARKQTNIDKYGYDNVSKVPEVRSKISEKQKELHPKQDKRFKKCEICGTEFELKWPYTQHTCSPECRGKYRKLTGVSKSAYDKSVETNLKKYGVENQGQREEIHKKMEDTMEERYGVRYARYLPEVEEKVKQTCRERYGHDYYIQTEECNRNNNNRNSKINSRFIEFIESKLGCKVSSEKYLEGKFFDVCLEDKKILIEVDPSYTHTCIGNHWNSDGLDSDYHLVKSAVANDNGYRCIHIFDWDDWDKVIDTISENQTIYARQCELKEISKQEVDNFTETYHISGKCNGQKYRYGLFYNNELVQIMSFGAPRYNHRFDYELLRLCTKSNYKVVGGASKLFKHFISTIEDGQSIISYCDRSKFNGTVYEQIGMKLDHTTQPNKIWSKGDKYITNNLLMQRGYDQIFNTDHGKGTSNEQLMIDNNWLPVYDCGQFVYTYFNLQ